MSTNGKVNGMTTQTIMDSLEERRRKVEETFKLDPVVSITLKGNDYTLEFNNLAVKEVLKDTGYNLMSTTFDLERMQNPEIMGSLLYRGLLTHHPDLTQDQVDRLFTYRHYPYILMKLRMALDLFMPIPDVTVKSDGGEPQEIEDPTKRPAQIGSDTGQ